MKYYPLIGILLMALAGCSGQRQAEAASADGTKARPIEVRVAAAESRHVEKAIQVTGSLSADEEVTLGPDLDGRLVAIYVDFGQSVRKGQVIAQLDKRESELALERSRASLAQALARIGLGSDQADVVPDTTPAIRQAQAQLDNARTKYESAQRLLKTGDVAQDHFVELEKAYNAAEAALDAARHDLRTSLANIQALHAEVHLAQKHLDDATLRAPFDATVAERMASPGQFLPKNGPVVRLVKTWPMRLRLDVPESAAQAARVGAGVSFTTDALPGEVFHATVSEVSGTLDPRSRSLSAEARLAAVDQRLKPGMFVQVRLVTQRDADVVMVPKDAILTVAGLTKLFVIQDGHAVEKRLEVGEESGGWVQLEGSGVNAGDRVAVSNVALLVNGAAVSATGS